MFFININWDKDIMIIIFYLRVGELDYFLNKVGLELIIL